MSLSNDHSANGEHELARLCHVIKRDDFDGYGFNLHAEKGKPGQYIGKVDDNSPAESSGLRQGDRIIEVNGVNIGNEVHKQVVQRIKAIACEVRLLVVDPNVVTVSNENIIVTSSENDGLELNHNILSNNMQTNGNHTAAFTHVDKSEASPALTPPPPPSTVSLNPSQLAASADMRDAGDMKMNGGDININSSQIISKSSSNSSKPTSIMSRDGLNLKMTAAELRAQLAAKKKYDPKTDTVDLRKKYEIVQKL